MIRILILISLFSFSYSLKAQTSPNSDSIPFLQSKKVLICYTKELSLNIPDTTQASQDTIQASQDTDSIRSHRHHFLHGFVRIKEKRDSIILQRERLSDHRFYKKYSSISRREPMTALGLSLVFPGAGQVYNKHYIAGGAFFISEVFLIGSLINSKAAQQNNGGILNGFDLAIEGGALVALHLTQAIMAPLNASYINSRMRRIKKENRLSFNLSPEFIQQGRNRVSNSTTTGAGIQNLIPGLSMSVRW